MQLILHTVALPRWCIYKVHVRVQSQTDVTEDITAPYERVAQFMHGHT